MILFDCKDLMRNEEESLFPIPSTLVALYSCRLGSVCAQSSAAVYRACSAVLRTVVYSFSIVNNDNFFYPTDSSICLLTHLLLKCFCDSCL